jgi:hypothetical protein
MYNLVHQVCDLLDDWGVLSGRCLVVVEGPSYGSPSQSQRGHHERAGLWWGVTTAIWSAGVPLVVVSPPTLKKYATGNHQADKGAMMVACATRLDWPPGNDNEADAMWLAHAAADHNGWPIAAMPAIQRAALDATTKPKGKPRHPVIAWPDAPRG